jgi:hypothetical protein
MTGARQTIAVIRKSNKDALESRADAYRSSSKKTPSIWKCQLKSENFYSPTVLMVDSVLNMVAHAQKPDFVFLRNVQVHLNRRGLQFNWLLAAEVCASAVIMLDTTCFEVVWRLLVTHSIRQFPLHFSSRVSSRAITFQLDSTCSLCSCEEQFILKHKWISKSV